MLLAMALAAQGLHEKSDAWILLRRQERSEGKLGTPPPCRFLSFAQFGSEAQILLGGRPSGLSEAKTSRPAGAQQCKHMHTSEAMGLESALAGAQATDRVRCR